MKNKQTQFQLKICGRLKRVCKFIVWDSFKCAKHLVAWTIIRLDSHRRHDGTQRAWHLHKMVPLCFWYAVGHKVQKAEQR